MSDRGWPGGADPQFAFVLLMVVPAVVAFVIGVVFGHWWCPA